MSILFMIGNGFDINAGMKTRYQDAYSEYLDIKGSLPVITKFKKDIKKDIENWCDFESAMADYASNFVSEDGFIECLNDFLGFLNLYLSAQEKEMTKLLRNQDVLDEVFGEIRNSICSFYEGITNNVNTAMEKRGIKYTGQVDFLSFNYTSAFDGVISSVIKEREIPSGQIIHIHGKINDMILGMDNETQIPAHFGISQRLKSFFVKPYFNKLYDINRVNQAIDFIDNADTICVYGMSLGVSDLTWRKKLIDWLKSSSNNHLFLYDYALSNVNYQSIPNRMDIEKNAKLRKLAEWGVEDIDSFFERFHIICGRNIFNIEDAIERGILIKERKAARFPRIVG